MKTDFFQMSGSEAVRMAESSLNGLSAYEAEKRLEEYGRNELIAEEGKNILKIILSQFSDLMIWVLITAAAVSAFIPMIAGEHPEFTDASIILAVVILNAALGAIQESRAETALKELTRLSAPEAKVVRDGRLMKIKAPELVPGDVIHLSAGDNIPADARILECFSLKTDEASLTGESVPVEKTDAAISDSGALLGDRINMVYMGTGVTYGRAAALVTHTGMNTQMGAIASHLASSKKESTPLQKQLNQITNILSIGVLCIAAIIFLLGIGSRLLNPLESFMTAVSLAVAAIPEGMAAVVTIVLAIGMNKMAGRGAIIRRLPAVETLGSTQIICSDKTGTLTQNRMTVTEIYSQNKSLLEEAMAHCNDSILNIDNIPEGDPTETALLEYLLKNKIKTPENLKSRVRAGEIPFDSNRKLSTVVIRKSGGFRIFVKGAPDILLSRCENLHNREEIELKNEEMANKALRVLAFGYKDCGDINLNNPAKTESGLNFIGLAGMIDPARPEAKEAISTCLKAGILPVMITGDHPATAKAIAAELGILSNNRLAITGRELEEMSDNEFLNKVERIAVYARVSPEHKSRIIDAWRKKGKICAMTGDGVNDAPALKSADIGVGMGITGTDVSKGASDMVLTDDNFATIVLAVSEGRRIFDNIHKAVRFLLSSNAGEVLAILTATLAGWIMLKPVHILWINLVTDTFPALALGVEPPERDTMSRPPRDRKTPFFTGTEWLRIGLVGLVEAVLAISAYLMGGKGELGTTMAFLTLSLSQLFAAVGFQSERHSLFDIKFSEHKSLWLAFLGSTSLQLAVIFIPPLRNLFGLVLPSLFNGMQVLALCLIMLLFIELQKLVARLRG